MADQNFNPWSDAVQQSSQSSQDAQNAYTGFGIGMQDKMSQLAQKMSTLQNAGQQYPTFQNDAGIGSGNPQSAAPQQAGQSMNPYSLQGDANSRPM